MSHPYRPPLPTPAWSRDRAAVPDARPAAAAPAPGAGAAESRPNNLYVKNLASDVTDDELKAMFEPYGHVLSCRVLVDRFGVSKKCAFVQFSHAACAAAAVSALHGRTSRAGTVLSVLPAASRGERRADAAAARAARLAHAGLRPVVLAPGGRAYGPPPAGGEAVAASVAAATGPAFVAAALGRGKGGAGREE